MKTTKKIKKRDKDPSFRRLLTVGEASAYLGISARTIYNSISPKSAKDFPVKPLRLGRAVRFDLKDLDAFVEDLKNER